MRIVVGIIAVCSFLAFLSCNQNGGTKGKEVAATMEKDTFPINFHKGGAYKSLDQIRVQARTIIDHRNSEEPKALAMLTYGWWWPEFVFNGRTMSAPEQYAGHWLKFNDDFTYNYGQYGKTMGNGKYHFRLDDKSLYMLDDNVELEPKVWTANYNGEVLALVGTHEYGVNNGMQMKLIGLPKQPEQ